MICTCWIARENVVVTLSSKISSLYSAMCVSPCGGLVIGISSPLFSVWSTTDGRLYPSLVLVTMCIFQVGY